MEYELTFWDSNPLAIGLGFFIGLVVGGIIAFLCIKFCMKDILKKKVQDAEQGLLIHEKDTIQKKTKIQETKSSVSKSRRSTRRKTVKRRGAREEEQPLMVVNPIILEGDMDQDQDPSKGLLDALVKDNDPDRDLEISDQDLHAVERLEKEFREENIDTMMQLLRTILNKHLQKGKLNPDEAKELLKNAQENMDDVIKTCNAERDEEEEELRKKIKDPQTLETEIDNLNSRHNQRTNSMIQNEKDRFRQDISKTTNLTDAEIDGIMAELTENMANLEHRLGMERMRQTMALEERLGRRRQMAQLQSDEQLQQGRDIDFRREAHGKVLTTLVTDGKLLDRQKEELLKQYEEDLRRIQMKHEEDRQRQTLQLADKLRARRAEKMSQLDETHDKQRETFLKRSGNLTDAKEVAESYHNLLVQQRAQTDEVSDELDDREADEIRKLARDFEKRKNEEFSKREEQFEDQIRTKASLSNSEVDRIMRLHQQEMERYENIKKEERRRNRLMMEEKLQQRRLKVEEEQKKALAEQQALKEQQEATVQKVLASQVELSQDAKDQIMKEHDQNMMAMNNHLQMSRLKQQKALESKLSSRRGKVEELRRKQEEVKKTSKKDKDKELLRLQKQLDEEERRYEADRSVALAALRERLARETEAALKEQESHVGLLLARLEVGQARRQAIIQKQDKTIKELEDKMAGRVASAERSGDDSTSATVNHLIQDHMSRVEDLSSRMHEARQRQDQVLQEKLQRKKLKKERDIEDRLETDAQRDWQKQQQTGMPGYASALLGQAMLETRHKLALNQLEREMQGEMLKQKELLNSELDEELNTELQEQKKSFLAQLAAISNMSKDDVNDLVDNAVND